jgi:hypothetical protein
VTSAPTGARLEVRRFRESDRPGIERLNRRLAAAGAADRVYPEDSVAEGSPELARDGAISERLLVAAEGSEVRGGVWLKEQDFWVGGRVERMGWAKYPVAESLISADYAGVPGALLIQLLREQPRLLALGMGGHDGPFARFLARMRWQGQTIPLFLFPCRPSKVLREFGGRLASPLTRTLSRVVAATGAAELVVAGRGWIRARPPGAPRRFLEVQAVNQFGSAADDLWLRLRDRYGFLASRDSGTLAGMYPSRSRGVTRLMVSRQGAGIGWLVVFSHDPAVDPLQPQFGGLSYGILADGLAAPDDVPDLLAAGHQHLRESGVDLIMSHQAHPRWQAGLSSLGYFIGPPRFAFYQAPAVTSLVGAIPQAEWHFTRGDCHGGDWR